MAAVPDGVRRGIWAVADQAIFALSNFVLLILLSREMPPEAFGAYSFALSIFFLATALHTAMLVEPMLVFGGNRYRQQMGGYLRRIITIGNSWFAVAVAALLVAVGAALQVFGQDAIGGGLIGLGLAAPFILLSLLLRRSCYLRGQIHVAVFGGVVYLVALVACIIAISQGGPITVMLAALPMGVAGALASAFMLWISPIPRDQAQAGTPTGVRHQHARYAGWASMSESIHWMVSNLPIIALPIWFGFAVVASFKITNLLYMPLFQGIAACTSALLPELSRRRDDAGFRPLARRSAQVFAGLAAAYAGLILLVQAPLMNWLYGDLYVLPTSWLVLMSFVAVFYSLAHVQFACLRAMERPGLVLRAYVALCVVLLLTLVFYPAFGVTAAIAGLAIGWGVACLVNAIVLGRTTVGQQPSLADTQSASASRGVS